MRPSPPLTAPTFPTFFELAGASVTETSPAPSKELFQSLIGDPRVLFQELLEDPSRFDEGVAESLQELISGKPFNELERSQRDLLNKATIDFATNKRPTKPKEAAPKQRLSAAEKAAEEDDEPELEWGSHGPRLAPPDAPSAMPTFWWRQ